MGISEATYYSWKKKYGGFGVSELRELRQLKEEKSKLKQMVADLSLDKQMLQDVLKKNSETCAAQGSLTLYDGQLVIFPENPTTGLVWEKEYFKPLNPCE